MDEHDVDDYTGATPTAGEGRPPVWGLVVVLVAFVALLAGGVALSGLGDEEATLPMLGLAGAPGEKLAATGAGAEAIYAAPVEYRLGGPLPDLGSEGPVYRLSGGELDDATLAGWAAVLGIAAQPASDGPNGWRVADADHQLSAYGGGGEGWSVSYGPVFEPIGCALDVAGATTCEASGSAPSAGSAGSSGGGSVAEPGAAPDATATTVVEPQPEPLVPTTVPPAPADLPDAAEAQGIARDLLDRMGVLDGDWEVAVTDGTSYGVAVACADGADCPPPPDPVVATRSVRFTRVLDGQPVQGLEWIVDVGDRGEVANLYGTHATVELLGDYPLRSTQEAYDALVAGELYYGGPMPLAGLDDPEATAGAVPSTFAAGSSSAGSGSAGANDPVEAATPEVPVEIEPDAPVEIEPAVVTVTGAELDSMVMYGYLEAETVLYVVPAYRFVGTYANGDAYEVQVPAVDPAYVEVPPVPVPETSLVTEPPSTTAIEPTPVPPEPAGTPPTSTPAPSGPTTTAAGGG